MKLDKEQGTLNFEEGEVVQKNDEAEESKGSSEMTRLAYYTLLAAAMEHRNKFYDQEMKGFQMLRAGQKKVNPKHYADLERAEKRLINFYKLASAETESFFKGNVNTKPISEYMALAAPEILLAKDPQELLMLLRMYNNGDLDILFAEYRKTKEDEKTNTLPEQETT